MRKNCFVVSALSATLCLASSFVTAVEAASLRFGAVLNTTVSSKTAKAGDTVKARITQPIHDGKKVIAPAGSVLIGQVVEASKSRRLLHAELSPKRWLRASGGVSIKFTSLRLPSGKTMKIAAVPVGVSNPTSERGKNLDNLKVSRKGEIQEGRSRDLKPKAARTTLAVASFIGAPFTPIIGAVAGAAKPSIVLPKADNAKMAKHRRLKGMATGFVAGIPGGFLIDDAVLKGKDTVLRSGTHIDLQWDK